MDQPISGSNAAAVNECAGVRPLVVVQARSGSKRLPGKVLADLGGRPLLAFMLERLRGVNTERVVVATTTSRADDDVASVAQAAGAIVVRGAEDNVLKRYIMALHEHPADAVVRLTADCPLMDATIVNEAIDRYSRRDAAYVSNTLVRTYPVGLDVEIVDASVLVTAHRESTASFEREHVTPYVYRHPERFTLRVLRNEIPLGDERWTVDWPADLHVVRQIVAAFGGRSDFSWRDAFDHTRTRRRQKKGLQVRPAMASDSDAILSWRNDPVSVAASGTGRTVPQHDHDRWFRERLDDGGTPIWIGALDGRPIAYVRMDVCAAVGTLSIAVDAGARGRGYGGQLLSSVIERVRAGYQVDELRARVRPWNRVSRTLFERAGFRISDESDEWRYYRMPVRAM